MKSFNATILLPLVLICMSTIQPVLSQSKIDSMPGKIIYFGHGGGFTGIVYKYALRENGDVFQVKSFDNSDLVFINKVMSFQASAVFNNIEHMGIDSIEYSHAGNMYSFIEIVSPGKTKRITWAKGASIPGNLKLFYEQLVALIPKQ